MDRALIGYAVNAAWQLPVLAAGAWLLVRTARPGPAARHRIWVAVLTLAVALPFVGLLTNAGAGFATAHVTLVPASTSSAQASLASISTQSRAAQPSRNGWIAEAEATLASLRFTHRIEISARTAAWISAAYLLLLLLGLMRILRAWSGARHLVRRSLNAEMTFDERALVAECAHRMGIKPPEIRMLDHPHPLAAPAVVGAARPVLLCPKGFVRQLLDCGREDEATAAILHEMAHIRRQDYAVNLMCEAWAAPLLWHPVTYGVTRQIREAREMACDAAAALAMNSEAEYARCLVGLAEQIATSRIVQQPGAVGLFHGNALEKRIMRLIDEHKPISTQARIARGAFGAAAMAAAVALATILQVVPARAQTAPVVALASQASPAPPASAQPSPVAVAGAKPTPAVAPQTQPAPPTEPKASPVPRQRKDHHQEIILSKDGKFYAWTNGRKHELTPAEQARVEKQLEKAKKQLAKQKALLNSPELKEQIEKAVQQARMAERQLQSAKIRKQLAEAREKAAEAQARINSPEFKAQLAQAQRQAAAATAKLQSPEFRKQMEQLQKKELNSAEMQRKLAHALKQQSAAMARINSRKLQEQIEQAQRNALAAQREAMEAQRKLESGQIQKQLKEAQKNLQKQLDQLKKQQLQNSQPGPDQP